MIRVRQKHAPENIDLTTRPGKVKSSGDLVDRQAVLSSVPVVNQNETVGCFADCLRASRDEIANFLQRKFSVVGHGSHDLAIDVDDVAEIETWDFAHNRCLSLKCT